MTHWYPIFTMVWGGVVIPRPFSSNPSIVIVRPCKLKLKYVTTSVKSWRSIAMDNKGQYRRSKSALGNEKGPPWHPVRCIVWSKHFVGVVDSGSVHDALENGIISSYKKWNSKCDQNMSVDPIYVGTYFFSIYLEDLLAWLGPEFDTRHNHMMWLSQIIDSEYYLVFTACFQPQSKLPLHTFNNASSSCSVTRSIFYTSCSLETHQSGRRWWWWGSWSRAPRRYHVHFISSRQNHFFDNVDELQQHVSWFLSAYMSNVDGHWFLKGYQCSRYLET